MRCPKCDAFGIFGNLSLDEKDRSRIYVCSQCGYATNNIKKWWKYIENKKTN